MEVGVFVRGQSILEAIPGIELKRCMSWKQLHKYNIRLLENVKKEDIENVKLLPREGSTYSIGAVDSAIKQLTLYITSLDEILNEKDAVLKEKQRSIDAIKETTEQKVALEQQLSSNKEVVAELREKIKDLKLKDDKNNATITDLNKQITALQDKLGAESSQRQKFEKELEAYKENLGIALEETDDKLKEQKEALSTEYNNEIDRINNVISEKNKIIASKEQQIEELKRVNEELGKAGVIPDITFKYEGTSHIIGVCSSGSYGVSSLVYTLYKILSSQKNVLIIDLDFKGGNIGKYIRSDNKALDNIMKGGPLLVEHIIKTMNGKVVDYIGGVSKNWTPYEILSLPWNEIFDKESKYDYILCDCGIYGGYNIQSKICEFIKNIGKMIFIYRDDFKINFPGCINIKNFSNVSIGIPFISNITAENLSLYDNPITKEIIHTQLINKIV